MPNIFFLKFKVIFFKFQLMLTTQFRFGKWHSACCNCAIMQRNWPAHASPGNILKNHPKEDDLQTLIGKKWAEIIDDVILLHSFGAKFSHSNNCKKKNVCFHEMVEEIKGPTIFSQFDSFIMDSGVIANKILLKSKQENSWLSIGCFLINLNALTLHDEKRDL